MIEIEFLKNYYPAEISRNPGKAKHILKEYVELLSLNYLSNSPYAKKITFIGGTNLRLVKGINRFSEDLDFDCKDLKKEEFTTLTNGLIDYLRKHDLPATAKDKESENLKAYRRSILFPELLYDMGLTGHKEERFMLKIETQDQGFYYKSETKQINRNGFSIYMQTPPDDILCSMKIAATLSRGKGRDFYDCLFLLQQTDPNFEYLRKKCGIDNYTDMINSFNDIIEKTDFKLKEKDFDRLLFNEGNSGIIHGIGTFLNEKYKGQIEEEKQAKNNRRKIKF